MNKYTIYLGLKNPNSKIEYCEIDVIEHLKTLFNYATIYHSQGIYKGDCETTLIIEIISNNFTDFEIKNICTYLKNRYEQECVMYTKQDIDMELV